MSEYKAAKNLVSTLIYSLLFLPTALLIIAAIFWPLPDYSSSEKRQLAGIPEMPGNFQQLLQLPQNTNAFFDDQWFLRNHLTSLANKILFNAGSKLFDDVYVGQHPWLFLRHEQLIQQYQQKNFFSQQDLDDWADYLLTRQQWLAEKGIAYLFVIVPNKHTLYTEHLPERLSATMKYSTREQWVSYMQQRGIAVLDVTEPLLQAKKENTGRLYETTGTHWNLVGANVANNAILQKVDQMIGLQDKVTFQPSSFKSFEREGHELAGWISQEKNLTEADFQPPETNNCKEIEYIENPYKICDYQKGFWCSPQIIQCPGKQKKVLVFRDSFYRKLQPLFAPSFAESVYILNSKDFAAMTYYAENYPPDIFIEEMVERNLYRIPPKTIN